MTLAIASALNPHSHTVIRGLEDGTSQYITYTGLWGFLMGREMEWLFSLCCAAGVLGLAVLVWPWLRGGAQRTVIWLKKQAKKRS